MKFNPVFLKKKRRGGGKRGKEKENEEGFCKIQT
jgi:hypothetical protein